MARRQIPQVIGGQLAADTIEGANSPVVVGSPAWYAWLTGERSVSFAYRDDTGNFTARRERKPSGAYWYAYRTVGGKLRKAYLGRAPELTAERLAQIARQLAPVPADRPSGAMPVRSFLADPADPADPAARTDPAPLLVTKLTIPAAPSTLTARERLYARLASDRLPLVTLIAAPAGSGKTTLLAAWARRQTNPVAWVSLDAGDDDPARCWAYIITALRPYAPATCADLLAALRSLQAPPLETLLIPLLNALAEGRRQVVLALDDYHVISTPAIHTALAFLIDAAPETLHVVIASRSDPPLPLARWRARRQLAELRATDLRFTREEVAAFLAQAMDLHLSAEVVAALEARTEGWIAGVQLAALSLQRQPDTAEFIAGFGGAHRSISDYLVDEVLRQQPTHIQAFLLRTAILERLCGPLCDAVTLADTPDVADGQNGQDGQATLEALERANLFLTPLDDARRWYRYHHLFADALRERVAREPGIASADLHIRASAWFESQGLLSEAVDHALLAADFARVARLIMQVTRLMLMRGEMTTLLKWLDALPEAQMQAHPQLLIAHAWALIVTGRLDRADQRLRELDASTPQDATFGDRVRGEAAAAHAALAVLRGEGERMLPLAQTALDQLSPDDTFLRGVVVWQLAQAYRHQGAAVQAERAFAEALRLSEAAGNRYFIALTASNRADRLIEMGRLREGAEAHRQLQRRASEQAGATSAETLRPFPALGTSCAHLADVLREWNDLAGAERSARLGVEAASAGSLREDTLTALTMLARIQQAMGTFDAALDTLRDAIELAETYAVAHLLTQAMAWRARIWLAQGAIPAALRWAQESGLHPDDPVSYKREDEYLIFARTLIASQTATEVQAAQRLLARMRRSAEAGGRAGRVIEILALDALAAAALGKSGAAQDMLARSLALAEPEGYMRLYVDEGAAMERLLRGALARNVTPQYCRRLLAVFGAAAVPSASFPAPATTGPAREIPAGDTADTSGAWEALSERERAVLTLIASGLSTQEIAATLIVSPNTIKTHIKHIYGKLGARSRIDAVTRARRHELL